MNWYKIRKFITKIAKHMSDHSHFCGLCGTFLKPKSFSKNDNHHFPWGINHVCDCGASSVWTNSIRNGEEFIARVLNNEDFVGAPSGICNDLYCPICYSYVAPMKNGLWFMGKQPVVPVYGATKEDDHFIYEITDLEKYMQHYMSGGRDDKFYPEFMGEQLSWDNMPNIQSYDAFGCRSKDHNYTIVLTKSSNEYGEGEYEPMWNWMRFNKDKIPQEMIKEFQGELV